MVTMGVVAHVGLRDQQSEVQRTQTECGQADARIAGQMALRGCQKTYSRSCWVRTKRMRPSPTPHEWDVLLARNTVDDVHTLR